MKIPSGQMAGGHFTVVSGQTKDLNIDFDACATSVIRGSGQYGLKPVLHGGEVSTTSASINGKLLDKATSQPIVGGKAIVALEQRDSSGIDHVVMQTTPDSSGAFVFCPVPAGSYDIVAVPGAAPNLHTTAPITTPLSPGTAASNIPLMSPPG